MESRYDQYRLLRRVHEGLYGTIELCEELATKRLAAVQVLHVAASPTALVVLQDQTRRINEQQISKFCRSVRIGQSVEGKTYIAWEWQDGDRLAVEKLDPKKALLVIQQLVAILAPAHAGGVVHGFLRPSQILVQKEHNALLVSSVLGAGLQASLGLPTITVRTDHLVFLAPECRSGTPAAAPSADMYSVGQLLRTTLGLPAREDREQWFRLLTEQTVPLFDTQANELLILLERLLSHEPEQRPTATEVGVVLNGLIDHRRDPLEHLSMLEMGETPLPAAAKQKDPLLGQNFGSFRLIRCIGQGGMGAVYEAKHKLIGTRAAVKILLPDLVTDDYARRFLDEARAVNIVSNPGVVSIFEFGQRAEDQRLYIVMEYLEGQSLEQLLETSKLRGAIPDVLLVAVQIAKALEAAHRAGIVHRDLKPSNVMLVADALVAGGQRAKVVDFGIAKVRGRKNRKDEVTELGAVMGTPYYMAPEQHGSASEATGKSDVFALGVILFEALTGERPFKGSSTLAVLAQAAPPLRSVIPSAPRGLAQLIDQMLRCQPDQRPTMSEVVSELTRILNDRAKWKQKRVLGAIGTLALVAGVTGWALQREPSVNQLQAGAAQIREHASAILHHELASDRTVSIRSAAVGALGMSRDPTYRDWIIPLTRDPDKSVVCAAASALSAIGDPTDGSVLLAQLDHPELSIRVCVASALTGLRGSNESHRGQLVAQALLNDPRITGVAELVDVQVSLAAELLQAGYQQAGDVLWRATQSVRLGSASRLHYLEVLSTSADAAEALNQLRQISSDSSRSESERLGAIASLVRVGHAQPPEAELLAATAARRGPNQLLAVWLRRHIPAANACELLWKVASTTNEPDERRHLAVDGLGYCGHEFASRLDGLLDTLTEKPLLRIAVAESALRMVGPDWQQSAELQQRFARSYQSGAALSDRLGFIDSLNGLPDDQVISSLNQVLQDDPDESVRKDAARALRPRQVRALLLKQAESLSEAVGDVAEKGVRAIGALLTQLDLDSSASIDNTIRAKLLLRLQSMNDPSQEIILRVLLLRAGQHEQAAILRSKLPTMERAQKLLAIEISDPRDPLVLAALSSSDPMVQFAAARHRALSGSSDEATKQVLRVALSQRDPDSLRAFLLLRSMGERPTRPSHLFDLLGRSEPVPVRWETVRLLSHLSLVDALPLLIEASTDPSVVIRREVVRLVGIHYLRKADLRLVDVITRLTRDPEVAVRIKATQFLRSISGGSEPSTAPIAQPQLPDRQHNSSEFRVGMVSQTKPHIPAGPDPRLLTPDAPKNEEAYLQVSAPVGVKVRLIGKNIALEPTSNREIALPAGRYQLMASCDESLSFELKPNDRKQARLCEVTQAIDQLRLLRQAGQLSQANAELGRLLLQLRGKEQTPIYDRVRFERGELRAASGNLRDALDDFNHVWGRHLSKPFGTVPTVEQKLVLLKSRVGRLSVYKQVDGRCVLVEDSLQMPGVVRTALLTSGISIRPGEHVVHPVSCRASSP